MGAVTLLAIFVLAGSYIAFPILPTLPVFVIMAGDSGSLMGPLFVMIITSLPLFFLIGLIVLFSKQKYLAVIILCLLALGAMGVYIGDYIRTRLESSASKIGISIQDNVPPGILNLPDRAIPKTYFLGRKGQTVKHDFSATEQYIKEYYSNTRAGGDESMIRLTYTDGYCPGFYFSKNTTPATCKTGNCVITENSIPASRLENGEWKAFKSYQYHYQINDNGSCAKISFVANEDEMLSSEQRQAVVDSLERVPGIRLQRPFSEKAIESIKRFNDILEAEKKRSKTGLYEKIQTNTSLFSFTEKDCVSTLHIDVAPNKTSYVIHRLACPDAATSYCIENEQEEVVKVPTAIVEKTYHCQ